MSASVGSSSGCGSRSVRPLGSCCLMGSASGSKNVGSGEGEGDDIVGEDVAGNAGVGVPVVRELSKMAIASGDWKEALGSSSPACCGFVG